MALRGGKVSVSQVNWHVKVPESNQVGLAAKPLPSLWFQESTVYEQTSFCVNRIRAISLNNSPLHTVQGNSYPLSKQTILGKNPLVSTCLF